MSRRATVELAGRLYTVDHANLRRAFASWRLEHRCDNPVSALADELGLSRCTVWRFFAGRQVGLGSAAKIAEALGLEPRELLTPLPPPTAADALAEARELVRRLSMLLRSAQGD